MEGLNHYQDLFARIQKANEAIRTTNIKGKEYAEVNQRIKAYRMVYPSGSITTEIVSCKEGVVLMKATVTDEDKNIIGTGYAYEKEQSSNVNKTSYIENCETSAVGRALGMCGFGIDTSVASADEVANAIEEQESEPKKAEPKKETTKTDPEQEDVANSPATQQQVTKIVNLYGSDPENFKRMLAYYKVSTLEDLTVLQASQAIEKAQARGEKHERIGEVRE